MSLRTRLLASAAAVLLFVPAVTSAQQQTQPPGQPAAPATQPSLEEARPQVEGFRKMIEDRLRTQLEATEEEFAILQPRIQKIQRLTMSTDTQMTAMAFLARSGALGFGMGAQTRPAADAQPANANEPKPPRPPNPMIQMMSVMFGDFTSVEAYQRAESLQDAYESKETSVATLKTRLTEYREARKAAKQEMTRAREELRALCTARQEATLVLLGILD